LDGRINASDLSGFLSLAGIIEKLDFSIFLRFFKVVSKGRFANVQLNVWFCQTDKS
jgi:hypothetical protein